VPERSLFWAEARSSVHPIRVETDGFTGFLELELEGDQLKVMRPSAVRSSSKSIAQTGNGLCDRELERRLEAPLSVIRARCWASSGRRRQ
jgi:hypothetical protein